MWECHKCGEKHEDVLDSCWKCGTTLDADASSPQEETAPEELGGQTKPPALRLANSLNRKAEDRQNREKMTNRPDEQIKLEWRIGLSFDHAFIWCFLVWPVSLILWPLLIWVQLLLGETVDITPLIYPASLVSG